MVELITEMLIYLGLAALLGLVLGYLVWGWGAGARISAARSEGAATARTSVDGDAGLRERFDASERDRIRLEAEVEHLSTALAASREKLRSYRSMDVSGKMDSAPTDAGLAPSVDDQAPFEPEHTGSEARDASVRDDPLDPLALEPIQEDEAEEVHAAESVDGPETANDEPPAFLLDERPEEVDDLKRIKGVGTVMEGVLNAKGVFLFHQLANLTESEIDWVNDAIEAFPGRIHRDRWVEQARELFAEKYGRAYDAD